MKLGNVGLSSQRILIAGTVTLVLILLTAYCLWNYQRGWFSHSLKPKPAPPALKQVIDHFQNHDPLKLRAAEFITKNIMPDIFEREIYVYDAHTVSPDFLIKIIEDAFKSSESQNLHNDTVFNIFLEYILPYRIFDEQLEDWRKLTNDHFDFLKDSLPAQDLVSLSTQVNENLKRIFRFEANAGLSKNSNWSELLSSGKGDCWGMTKIAAFAHRGLGIPVAIDYVPAWGNINGGHAWNTLICHDGPNIPFMGAEVPPGNYNPLAFFGTYKKAPKVFRRTFSKQPDALPFESRNNIKVPLLLNDYRYKDVTHEYLDTARIILNLDTKPEDSFVYISSFNWGNWTPLDWSESRQKVIFKNLGKDIIYLAVAYRDEKIVPLSAPLLLDSTGATITIAIAESKEDLVVENVQCLEFDILKALSKKQPWSDIEREINLLKRGTGRSTPSPGQIYSLYYWDNGWKRHGTIQATTAGLTFNGVPTNTLYRLIASGSDGRNERPFIYHEGKQVWY
jgi:hypothetical protein